MTIVLIPTPERPLAYWLQWNISRDYELITSKIDGVERLYFYVR